MNAQSFSKTGAASGGGIAIAPNGLPFPMEKKAADQYTLERITIGPVFRAQYLLVVRSSTDMGCASQVVLTTGDRERALRVEQRVRRALAMLPVAEFETFIGMNRRVRSAADVMALPS